MRLLIILALLVAIAAAAPHPSQAYAMEPSHLDAAELNEIWKRFFLPAKERRAPLEGFEDMSGFLRTIDGIQKPRFG